MTGLALGGSASPLWYATRATGIVTLLLLTMTVLLGLAGSVRLAGPGLPRVVVAGLHRNVPLAAACLLAVHVLTAVADSYVPISLANAVLPFSSAYRPLWLGLGAVALDAFVVVAATSMLRERLRYRAWRAVHWLGYVCWPAALWHGLGTGTDSRSAWMLALDAACAAAVAAAAAWRLSLVPGGRGRLAAVAAAVVLPLATAVFVAAGPLQPGWARRAGTPPALLHHAAVTGPASGSRR